MPINDYCISPVGLIGLLHQFTRSNLHSLIIIFFVYLSSTWRSRPDQIFRTQFKSFKFNRFTIFFHYRIIFDGGSTTQSRVRSFYFVAQQNAKVIWTVLTEQFDISKPQNSRIVDFYAAQKRRSTAFEALKWRNVRSVWKKFNLGAHSSYCQPWRILNAGFYLDSPDLLAADGVLTFAHSIRDANNSPSFPSFFSPWLFTLGFSILSHPIQFLGIESRI